MGRECRECIRLLAEAFSELSMAETYREMGKSDLEIRHLEMTRIISENMMKNGCIPPEVHESIRKWVESRDYDAAWGSITASAFFVASKCQRGVMK